jgi:hypothetical protein|mmetsp:Transcript_16823/g.18874  ORF Transcript_16823/g.18874 Transcript_16823/m.18874 type:complete len:265 (+) Transcript_16823:158-952(+)
MVSSPKNHHDDEHTMKKAEMLIEKLAMEANRQRSIPPTIDGYSGGSYQSYHSPSPSPMRTTSSGSGTKKIVVTNHGDDNSSLGDGEGVPPMTVSVTTDNSSSSSSICHNSPIQVMERRQHQQQLEALDSYQRAYTMAERSMTENSLDESALQAHVAEQTARRMQEEVIGHCCHGDDPGSHPINSRYPYDDEQESLVSTCVRTMWQCLQGGARGNANITIPTDYFSNNKTAGGSGQYVPAYDFATPQDEHSGLLGSPSPSGITRL